MYDYYLGGKDNFAADRAAAEQALAVAPELRSGARQSRRFLTRVIQFMVGEGIRQFIDIGCGLPTQGNVHEIARAGSPDVRVAYVDNDPVVISHARALLENNPLIVVVQADLREPAKLLADPDLRNLIDLRRPVGVVMSSVLHIIPDDELALSAVRHLRDAVVPGSYIAIAHAVSDLRPDVTAALSKLYQTSTKISGPHRSNLRNRAEVEVYFDGLELVEPGFTYISEWRPDEDDDAAEGTPPMWAMGGVARKG
jgi:SAM-dependent methyltransferase